jgi:uncharacterized membrane protein YphA (DoxX/SURF4 family)
MSSVTCYFPAIARILMGLIFVVFGLNGFLNFIPQPKSPIPESAVAFIEALMNTGYLFQLIMGAQLFVGILLLVNRFVPLALALIAPVIVGIITFHIFLQPSGWPMASVVFVLEIYLAWAYREAFLPMLVMRVGQDEAGVAHPIKWIIRNNQPKESPVEADQCSFCRKSRSKISKLLPGPGGIRICNKCLEKCDNILRQYENESRLGPKKSGAPILNRGILRCSFCLKSENEVKYLVAGSAGYICGDCALRLREGIE